MFAVPLRRTIRHVTAFVLLAPLLAGCATSGGYGAPRVPAGTVVELEQPLDMPAGKARVYIQDGRVVPWSEVNWFVTYCSFGLRKDSGESLIRTIRPGRFDAGGSSSWAQATRDAADGIRVAGQGWPRVAMRGGEGSPGRYTFYTRVQLDAPEQPQVDDLTCAHEGDDFDTFPTLAEIRTALGDVATLRVPQ